jgi:hypothetical protein
MTRPKAVSIKTRWLVSVFVPLMVLGTSLTSIGIHHLHALSLSETKLPPERIEFEHLAAKDGLANMVVYDMVQDKLMWSNGNGHRVKRNQKLGPTYQAQLPAERLICENGPY